MRMPEKTVGPLGTIPAILLLSEIEEGDRIRQDYDDDGELEMSIREHGIIQPLLVMRQEEKDPKYLLLAGGRRLRAATEIGLAEVPVLITTKDLGELEIRTIEMIENLHRRDLNYEEKLRLTKMVHELQVEKHGLRAPGTSIECGGWTHADTARLLGCSRQTITQELQLAEAVDKLPELRGLKNQKEARQKLDLMIKHLQNEDAAREVDKQLQREGPKKSLINSYIIKDFFLGVADIPDGSIDFVEIDPPYGIELQELYEKRSDTMASSYRAEDYKEVPADEYLRLLSETLAQSYRTMAEHSWGICWFAMEPWFEPTFQAIIKAGFYCRRVPGFWVQPTGASYNANLLLSNTMDSFFYFRKGQPRLNKPGRLNSFVYGHVPPSRKIHPTERPIELLRDILETFCMPGSRVLVPYAGSGATILAAANARMPAIGYDLTANYKNGYVLNVNNGDIGHYKSLG